MCSKSRQTLGLINETKQDVQIFEYLNDEIDEKELRFIIEQLNISPLDLIRKGEAIFKENYKSKTLTDEEWIGAMLKYPKLIERPIVINNGKVIIGRPPEKVLTIIGG